MNTTLRLKLIVLTGSVLLSALGAELLFRLYLGWSAERDQARLAASKSLTRVDTIYLGHIVQLSDVPDLIYELKPNLSGKYYSKRFTTSAAGLRGIKKHSLTKAPGVLRILGLGDSYMFGQRVADGETYLDQLEQQLAAQGRKVETINLAVPGYNTSMELASLKHKGLVYDPDLIVLGVVGNDWDLPDFMLDGPIVRPLGSAVLGKIYQILHGHPALTPTPRSKEMGHRFLYSEKVVPPRYRHMVGYEAFLRALGRLHRLATEAGAKVVLFSDCLPRSATQVDCDFYYKPGEKRALWQHLKQWDFTVCEWAIDEKLRVPNDGHPTAEGHKELARQLGACIGPLLKQ